MSSALVVTAGASKGGIVSPFIRLPPELRLLIYNNLACDEERPLALDKVLIYYHDVDPAILECCKLLRREAHPVLRRMRLDIPPTLVLSLHLPEILIFIDTPKSRSLSAVVRMLLGGYHHWLGRSSSSSASDVPMGFCDFFRRFEQSLSGLQSEDYIVTSQRELEAFYRRTLYQMRQTRSLKVLLRLTTHCTQQLRADGIMHLLPLGGSFGPYDPRLLSLDIVLVINAEHISLFEGTVTLSADEPTRSLFRMQPLDTLKGGHETDMA